MAEDVIARPRAAEAERPVARRERARRSAYRLRFAVVYVLLAAVAGASLGGLIVLLSQPGPRPGPKWSDWEPRGSAIARERQIADRIGSRYRLPSGQQLAAAYVGPPKVQDVPVRAIAVRPDTSTGQAEESDIDVFDAEGSVMYILCGLGTRCSIAEGRPTEARGQLVRREALELALYTFKYVQEVGSVVVFLPPRPDAEQKQVPPLAVFLRRSDVRERLEAPLSRTFARAVPPVGALGPAERETVEGITRPRLYEYAYQQAQEGSAVLVLTPYLLAGQ